MWRSARCRYLVRIRLCVRENVRRHYYDDPYYRSIERSELRRSVMSTQVERARFRARLVARDGGFFCFYCKTPLDSSYHIDHKTPIAGGGEHALANFALACLQCNQEKHNKDIDSYRAWLRKNGEPVRFFSPVGPMSRALAQFDAPAFLTSPKPGGVRRRGQVSDLGKLRRLAVCLRIVSSSAGSSISASVNQPVYPEMEPKSTGPRRQSDRIPMTRSGKRIRLALLWQIYSRCFSVPIQVRQYGHRRGLDRMMRSTMACRMAGSVG